MGAKPQLADEVLIPGVAVESYGSISIRVVVLPKKQGAAKASASDTTPLDLGDDEFIEEEGSSALSSYLESGKGGKQCCVFLVNGQRQDALDNSFVREQLGFKYLRNRMMVIVDVDDLAPEALGRLMQGSRQGFFKGEHWDALMRRMVATLKGDPDLQRLEIEAEEAVAELTAGDEKVKETLDQLIESHHDLGSQEVTGAGAQGSDKTKDILSFANPANETVVALLDPTRGSPASEPVLTCKPVTSHIRLRPGEPRELVIVSRPENAWSALSELIVAGDAAVPELVIKEERLTDRAKLTFTFREPKEFDNEQYPVNATVQLNARFKDINEVRRLELKVSVKPEVEPPAPDLLDVPTWLRVSSRQPVQLPNGDVDVHVRLRWNGKDELAAGPTKSWTFTAALIKPSGGTAFMHFSQPRGGRFNLLIAPQPDWVVGTEMQFQVVARSLKGETLSATFNAVVVEPKQTDKMSKTTPRAIESTVARGSTRRPPYKLVYIKEKDFQEHECWGKPSWTDEDPGCFTEPTATSPLTLFLNTDMRAMRDYARELTKKGLTEAVVERRITKYNSHIAFHLYQMYQSAMAEPPATDSDTPTKDHDAADQARDAEIRRVAMTLIKLMEVVQ